jgi:hypothetical protein
MVTFFQRLKPYGKIRFIISSTVALKYRTQMVTFFSKAEAVWKKSSNLNLCSSVLSIFHCVERSPN